MARRRKQETGVIAFKVEKPPEDITFIAPDSILEPYPYTINLKKLADQKEIEKKFKEYIYNGIAWANEQRKRENPYARYPSEALVVNNLRLKVMDWRKKQWPGITETTRELFRWWFEYPREKSFWFSQREAIETLVYLFEVEEIFTVSELVERFGAYHVDVPEEYNQYPRFAFRMATGSGKTLTMALIAVWSYFNYLFEDREKYSRFSLFVTPNLIVYDRIKRDIEGLRIFKEFDLIPKDWEKDFNLRVITKDTFSDADRYPPPEEEGVIFVSNIHQIGFPKKGQKEKEDLISSLLDLMDPGSDPYKASSIKLWDILSNYPNLLILKDEAHHIHREESSWQKYLWDLNKALKDKHETGIFMELDFSATPKDEKGRPFSWIVVDFSLREALQSGIVKYPAKVVLLNAPRVKRGTDIEAMEPYIQAALDRWRKHKEKLKPLNKKPILFVMADNIQDAEKIYERLIEEPDVDKGNTILIHSELDKWKPKIKDKKGGVVISKLKINGEEKELDKDAAIELVRKVDEPDNPIEVIVSVLMLNEGWDVRSVTAILGLRSYASEREILPEQVIGRGLRKLFPDQGVSLEKWINILEVVGPPNLLKILDSLQNVEGIKIPEIGDIKEFIAFVIRHDLEDSMRFKIPKGEFVTLSDEIDIEAILDEAFSRLQKACFKTKELKAFDKEYPYIVVDTKGKTIDKGTVLASLENLPMGNLFKLAQDIQERIPLPGSFESITQRLVSYIEEDLFDQKVTIDDKILRFLFAKGWFGKAFDEITQMISGLIKDPIFSSKVQVDDFIDVARLEGFPWNKQFEDSEKSLFARVAFRGESADEQFLIPSVPVDNEMEADFVRFLNRAQDVVSFIKNVPYAVRLSITYYDSRERRWRRFYPDFVVKTKTDNGREAFYVVETKGREEIQVSDKNRAANLWCKAISDAIGERWKYLYLREGDWGSAICFSDLE